MMMVLTAMKKKEKEIKGMGLKIKIMKDLADKITFKERSDKVLSVNDAANWEKRTANAEALRQKHSWQHSMYSKVFNQCSF